jgi:hypothetical protein
MDKEMVRQIITKYFNMLKNLNIEQKLKREEIWDITPYSLLKINQCFRGTYGLYLQG